jgi:methylase of polypeptide subunit release factors
VVQADFRKYRSSDKFDVIVSNPPYFVDSLECPDRQRAAARHNDSLTYEDLLEGARRRYETMFTKELMTELCLNLYSGVLDSSETDYPANKKE